MRILISVLALAGGLVPLAPASAAPVPVGTCWNLTSAQRGAAWLPVSTPVDCDTSHTAELLAVVRGTDLTRAGVFQQCQGLAVTYVGGAPTALAPSSYALPRTAQLSVYTTADGKRAYCVGFSTNARGRVVTIQGTVEGTGLKPRVCLNSVTWAKEGCSATKSVAMTNVAWLSTWAGQPYPGNAKAMKLARAKCSELGNSVDVMAQAWFVPGTAEWSVGNHYALCRVAKNGMDTGWQDAQ